MVQLSFEASVEGRDAAMRQAEEHAQEVWRDAAMDAIWETAKIYHRFIVDQVWTFMPDRVQTHEKRAMGPMMVKAVKEGWIAQTDEYRLSERVASHRNPRRVWQSLIHSEGAHNA